MRNFYKGKCTMKAKHKGIIIEWGILTIISFLFYDIIWIPTSEDFSFLQIKDVANYLLADFTYCACLSFCIIWIDFHINSSLKFEIKAKQFYAASQRVL